MVFVTSERCFVVLYLVACERRIFVCLQANGALMINICCKHNKGFCIVEYCKKEIISDKKHSARTERRVNIGKKTIQVSNFHNAAETDVNLTGRKQILIQSGCCLFFLTGKRHIIFGNIFKPYKVRFNFSKKRNRGFSFEKDLERNEKHRCSRVPKAERFFILRITERKNCLILFTEKLSGRKTAFIQKVSNRLTREQNFLIIDWHCYIIITIVTKK